MKSLKLLIVMMVLGIGLAFIEPAKAQCAMCSATVETSNKSGTHQTSGLNNGILYLLAAPYLAVAAGGYLWYKKYRRKDVDINMRGEKINLN